MRVSMADNTQNTYFTQYEPGQSQLCRLTQQAQAELTELRLKTKPKVHDPALLRAAE